jgi:glycosyltransferase involved in cell wall biosynthesis
MKIAVFDYRVTLFNPVGSCHRRILSALCEEHEFVVFAAEFDNPRPDLIRHVPIKVPLRPLALLFILFHLSTGRAWRRYRRGGGSPADLVQSIESNCLSSDVVYAHFCHRGYLRLWGGFSLGTLLTYRSFFRWLDHRVHALMEPIVYRSAKHVVVPSGGLARELIREYPVLAGKVTVINNAIDTEAMKPPARFDRTALRRQLGFTERDLVLIFSALGHFDRKGLTLIMKAMNGISRNDVKLLVVGGDKPLVRSYRRRAAALNLGSQVVFVGRQREVRRFLWLADAFVFPTAYEAFSLSILEAAAAGLPLIVTRVHGVEDFAADHENAFLINRSVAALQTALNELLSLSADRRRSMGHAAQLAVSTFTVERFASEWRRFYRSVGNRVEEVHAENPLFRRSESLRAL